MPAGISTGYAVKQRHTVAAANPFAGSCLCLAGLVQKFVRGESQWLHKDCPGESASFPQNGLDRLRISLVQLQ